VKKSAVIIGSSAGIGAGVGAAIHGKKGALIGAALGGIFSIALYRYAAQGTTGGFFDQGTLQGAFRVKR
jgi:hypothetical protein